MGVNGTPALRCVMLVSALCFFVVCGGFASAQVRSQQLVVSVTDLRGTALADAEVTLLRPRGELDETTDSSGRCSFATSDDKEYLRVQLAGFETVVRRVPPSRNAELHLSVTLRRSVTSLLMIADVHSRSFGQLTASSVPSVEYGGADLRERGAMDVADVLHSAISVTAIRPAGGGAGMPAFIALRGPDPSETLVELDGHPIGSAATNAIDLSSFGVDALSGVQVIYGIAPSSLAGPNTLGGAVNMRSLEPTLKSNVSFHLGFGSPFTAQSGVTATGTQGKLGYAFALGHTALESVPAQTISTVGGGTAVVGSESSRSLNLLKLRYWLGPQAYAVVSARNDVAQTDLSAALSSITQDDPATHLNFAGSTLTTGSHIYGLDLGISGLVFRVQRGNLEQSVDGPANGSSPFLTTHHDAFTDASIEYERAVRSGVLSLKFDDRTESLLNQPGGSLTEESTARRGTLSTGSSLPSNVILGDRQTWVAARLALDPSPKLHYTFAAFASQFGSFGSSLDPRFGFTWTPNEKTTVRASAGTTFQAPQLPERYVPAALPAPGPDGYISIGNPALSADRAAEYDLGFEHLFGRQGRLRGAVDLYTTNVRGAAMKYVPPYTCDQAPSPEDCISYPINAARAIYRGMELRFALQCTPATIVRTEFGVASAFVSDAVSSQLGSFVAGEQALGVPLQKGSLTIEHNALRGMDGFVRASYEGRYNELNRPPFMTLDGGLGIKFNGMEARLTARNITDTYADRFTRLGAGVVYGGPSGPIPTDAYPLQPRTLMFTVSAGLP